MNDPNRTPDDLPISSGCFSLTADDMLRLWKSFPAIKRYGWGWLLFICILPGLWALFYFDQPLAFWFASSMVAVKFLRFILNRRPDWHFEFEKMEPTTATVRDQYFERASESAMSIRSWRMIEACERTRDDLLIHFAKYVRLNIPLRSFDSEEQIQRFLSAAHERIDHSKLQTDVGPLPKLVLNPDPISLQFQSTRFMFAIQQSRLRQAQNRNQGLGLGWSFLLLGVPTLVAIGMVSILHGPQRLGGDHLLRELIALAIFVFLFVILQYAMIPLYRNFLAGDDATASIPISVDVDSTGIEVHGPDQSSFTRWNHVDRAQVFSDQSLAIISQSELALVIIPASAFEDEKHRNVFAQMVTDRSNQNAAIEDVTNAIPLEETGNPYQSPPDRNQLESP